MGLPLYLIRKTERYFPWLAPRITLQRITTDRLMLQSLLDSRVLRSSPLLMRLHLRPATHLLRFLWTCRQSFRAVLDSLHINRLTMTENLEVPFRLGLHLEV